MIDLVGQLTHRAVPYNGVDLPLLYVQLYRARQQFLLDVALTNEQTIIYELLDHLFSSNGFQSEGSPFRQTIAMLRHYAFYNDHLRKHS